VAVLQTPFAFGTLAGSGVADIHTTPADKTEHPFLVLTNDGATVAEVNVTIESASVVRNFSRVKISAGAGKKERVLELSDTRLAPGYTIGLQLLSGGPVNYFLSGVRYDV